MSYLIALYVYYHGNNLPLFGFIKGDKDIENQNKGMKRADEIDPTMVDPSIIQQVKVLEEQETTKAKWESMMKEAQIRAQQDTYQLHKSGLIQGDVFDNTPDQIIEDMNSDNGEIDLSFFNSLNGF